MLAVKKLCSGRVLLSAGYVVDQISGVSCPEGPITTNMMVQGPQNAVGIVLGT